MTLNIVNKIFNEVNIFPIDDSKVLINGEIFCFDKFLTQKNTKEHIKSIKNVLKKNNELKLTFNSRLFINFKQFCIFFQKTSNDVIFFEKEIKKWIKQNNEKNNS